MNKPAFYTIAIVLLFLILSQKISAQNHPISGIVKDAKTQQAISSCSIIILHTTIGTTTNESGKFSLVVPQLFASAKLLISSLGYTTDTIQLNPTGSIYTIELKAKKENLLNDIVVSGVSRATRIRENPLAMESVSRKQIEHSSEDNVIDAIAKNAPGLETVKTGPNVSKPFINGLGYNRVLTLYDGMRIETQQWGDEHGVPIDDYIIERAEVIKGPASLLYGSDAIAGVLSLFPTIPHDTDKIIHGKFLSEYQTNNGMAGNSLQLMYGNAHWSWALRGSGRIARNYTDPIDGRVYNTGFKMINTSGFVGYNGYKGYSHLNFTLYDNQQGIPDGSRDSLTRKFTYQVYETQGENTIQPLVDNIKNRPIVSDDALNSYTLSPLHQRIQDYRLYTDNLHSFGQSDIKFFLGAEQNIRREYDHPINPTQAGEYIVLNTLNYGLRYNAPSFLNIETSFGVNGMYQNNTNLNATDFPIPDYHLLDIGTYGYAKWKYNKWTIAGGIRYDHRNETGNEMYIKPDAAGFYQQVALSDSAGGIKQFNAFNLHFQGISGSIGATYQVNDKISFKANIARGYRSPNITEIASNGLDPGAHIVYEGNLDFVPEFSLQEDIGVIGTFPTISFGLNAFNNSIQHYIYEAQEVDQYGNPIIIVPGNKTLQFQQTKAQLYGMDAMFNITPRNLKELHLNNVFSFVYGYNRNPKYKDAGTNGEYLPFIPPPRLLSSIDYDITENKKILQSISLKAEADYNMAQDHYLGLDNTETATAGYLLLNASIHTDINYTKKQVMQVQLSVNNVLNTAYQSHLSRLQYFEYYKQSPNGHLGIYNMGRNICMKIIMSF
jgi:iron complex outermembrane recepter protein